MKQSKGQIVRNNIYMLKLIWSVSHKKVIYHIGINLMQSVLDFINGIYFLRTIVDIIESGKSFQSYLIFILIILALNTFRGLANAWYYYNCNELLNLKVQNSFNEKIFKKAQQVELSCYENPDFYNSYNRAVSSINSMVVQVMDNIAALISFLFLSIIILTYIGSIDPFIYIFGVCPVIASFLVSYNNKLNYKKNMEMTPANRKKEYIKRTFFLKDFSKEIKMTKICNVLNDLYKEAIQMIMTIIKKYGVKLSIINGAEGFVTSFLAFIGGNAYAAFRFIFLHNLGIADFSVLTSSITTFNNRMNRAIGFIVKAKDHSLYIENLRTFLEYEPKMQSGFLIPPGSFNTLELKNVSFAYESDLNILKNINFTIHQGDKIAIVGLNGAGKSTLVKLLLRLYDPSEGEILYNGENIKNLDIIKYRENFGTVFQDFQIYSLSVSENIILDEFHEEFRDNVLSAVKDSDLFDVIHQLPEGIDTILTREFDRNGKNLSGGEAQKIAIARVMCTNALVAILDEPSSALDPIAEYRIFKTLMKVAENRTVIFISHRLSSAVLADKILLLKNGKIIESGNHEELLRLNGEYAHMFSAQAQNYRSGVRECEIK